VLLSFTISRPSTPIPHHRMFGSSMGDKQDVDVWVGVQVGDEPSGSLVKLRVPSNIYVIDLKKNVQEEYKASFGKDIVAPEVS
jgi:hypothetical protein